MAEVFLVWLPSEKCHGMASPGHNGVTEMNRPRQNDAIWQTTFSNIFSCMKIVEANFSEVCSLGFNWQCCNVGLDNGLAQNRRQGIIWTDNSFDAYMCHSTSMHYSDVIMDSIASQITSLTIVHWIVYSDADQRKHPRHWPLCGEFTGDRGIPRTNGQ